jgi:GntR family transcriptional regulator
MRNAAMVGRISDVRTVHAAMHNEGLISQTDRRPKYLQIIGHIRHRIATGDWAARQGLPSLRTLAIAAHVSIITVRRAYLELERDGVIVTRPGRGSFVSDGVDLGARIRQERLDEYLTAAAAVAAELGLPANELANRLLGVTKSSNGSAQ